MLLPLPLIQNVRYDCLAWSVDETAAVCGVSDGKVWGHVRSGHLPLRKVGLRARRVSRGDLLVFLERQGRCFPRHEINLLSRGALSLAEVGLVLGLSPRLVANLERQAHLPVFWLSATAGSVRLSDLAAWLAAQPVVAGADFRDPVRRKLSDRTVAYDGRSEPNGVAGPPVNGTAGTPRKALVAGEGGP